MKPAEIDTILAKTSVFMQRFVQISSPSLGLFPPLCISDQLISLSLSSPINTKVTFTVWMADQGIFEMGRGKKTGVPWWDHPMYHGSPLRLPCLNSPDIPVRVRKVGEGTLSLHKNFLTCALSPNSSSFHKFRPIHPIFTCGEVEMCTLLNLAYQEYDR